MKLRTEPKLKNTLEKTLLYIQSHFDNTSVSPTHREIAKHTGASRVSTVQSRMRILRRKGFVNWIYRAPRTIVLTRKGKAYGRQEPLIDALRREDCYGGIKTIDAIAVGVFSMLAELPCQKEEALSSYRIKYDRNLRSNLDTVSIKLELIDLEIIIREDGRIIVDDLMINSKELIDIYRRKTLGYQ